MERALKERVIGAVVLVVIAVLVVPVFLDGPSTVDETVTRSVTLPGQNGQPRKRQTIVLERDRDQPVPAAARRSNRIPPAVEPAATDEPDAQAEPGMEAVAEPAAAEPDPEPGAASAPPPSTGESSAAANVPAAESTPDPEPEATDEPPAESATGMWAVQLGSFAKRSNAEGLAAELRSSGYAAFLSQVTTASGELNRVRIGPQKDRESAEAVAAKLKADGHKGQVVTHP